MLAEYAVEKMNEWLERYKANFRDKHWDEERYKWAAVKQFQDAWDIDSPNLPGMLEAALSKTNNLLTSANSFPKGMIVNFAKIAPDKVRSMFYELLDETKGVIERIEKFKEDSEQLRVDLMPGAKNHYQDENTISTYLWLRYPDKYYIYKFGEAKAFSKALNSELEFIKGRYVQNLQNFFLLYNAVHDALVEDASLTDMLTSCLDEDCYPDPEARTLTFDFGFYVSRMYQEGEAASEANNAKVWWLNANPKIWSFAETPVGEIQAYTLFNENGNKRRIFQNLLDAKPGDIVIGYESNPVKQIVALGEIVEGSDGKKISFKKTEALSTPIDYQDLKSIPELQEMEFFINPNGSLFKVSPDEYSVINDLIREYNPVTKASDLEKYNKQDFLADVYLESGTYDRLERVLKKSKNLILQGAPGTGKTFAAKRLAYAMMGVKDDARIRFVQFHQNYSYEDFVMGYKPDGESFKLKTGIFYEFCKTAESHPDDGFFFIIDEINRGNMSKIFGELLMLIESSHRGDYVALAYNGIPFTVPKNLYIIGMMNTADRSLAMIDYALRRRFVFYEMEPAFESDGFKKEAAKHDSEKLQNLIGVLIQLNSDIQKDPSLGKGFRIGHSYLCALKTGSPEELADVVELEIIPMLQEYWFDDDDKVVAWTEQLEAAIR